MTIEYTLKHRVCWLPYGASTQTSLNRQFARMKRPAYNTDQATHDREIYREYGLVPLMRDKEYAYFASPAIITQHETES